MSTFNPGPMLHRRRVGFGDDLTTILGDIPSIANAVTGTSVALQTGYPSSSAVSAATELIPLALVGFVIYLIISATKKSRG